MKRTSGPSTGSPSGLAIVPASRSCTYSRSLSFAASFATFGRLARRSACHCAVVARYSKWYVRVDALRRSSLEIVDGARFSRRDRSYPNTPRVKDCDLFPLSKGEIAPRERGQRDWRHPATVAEPPAANRLRHPRRVGRVFARPAPSNRPPEPLPILPPRHRGPTRRPDL